MTTKGKTKKAKKQVFTQKEPVQIERCWVCGGTDYTLNKTWPDFKYCAKCGLKMDIMNYEAVSSVRDAIHGLNGLLAHMDITGQWKTADVYKKMTETVNALGLFFNHGMNPKNTDLIENFNWTQAYMRDLRDERRADNLLQFPKKA